MKKPPKRKPKHRQRQPASVAVQPGGRPRPVPKAASGQAPAATTLVTRLLPQERGLAMQRTGGASPRGRAIAVARPAYSEDDRRALTLLLLPFVIVAFALGMSQTWRIGLQSLPEIAAAPASVRMPAPAPVDIARVETRPLTLPSVAPVVPPVVSPVSPSIELTTPLPVLPSKPPVVAAVPSPQLQPAPAFDIANWSPPRPVWGDALLLPPSLDAAPSPQREASVSPVAPPAGEICAPPPARLASFSNTGRLARAPRVSFAPAVDPAAFGLQLAAAAREQTHDLVIYSARYSPMAYPMGDLPSFYGACTDLVIRAYRALGVDLQELVQRTHAGRGDPNIDHRRTETLRGFFARQGASLPVTAFPEDYKPGDVVTYYRPFSRVSNSHIAIVSDVLAPTGRPMIVHNRGWGPQLEDALFVDRITGHYRYAGPRPASGNPQSVADEAQPQHTPGRDLVKASLPLAAALHRRQQRAEAAGAARERPAPPALKMR